MQGTLTQKVARLVGDLVSHPQYIPRVARTNLLPGRTPLDLAIPWFSYGAIDFLERYLRLDMIVCEYGSGGSTLFFAQRTKFVYSIEDNAEWYQRVSERLRNDGIMNVKLQLHPFDFKNPVGFVTSSYLHAMPDVLFDVIVVDGSEEWTQVRPVCFRHAEKHIKPGGIIVVDDSWRYPVLRTTHQAKRFEIFQSVGPCRPGVTSTDVFFY